MSNAQRFIPDTSHYEDCGNMLSSVVLHRKLRIIISLIFFVISFNIHTLPRLTSSSDIVRLSGLLSIPAMIVLLILVCNATLDHRERLTPLLIFLAIFSITSLIQPGVGIALLFVFVTQIFESRRYEWLSEQEGFPHFDYHTTLEEYGLNEYEADYDVDEKKHGGVMPELTGNEMDAFSMPRAELTAMMKNRAPASAETAVPARPSAPVPEAFAGISPMDSAKPEEIPAPPLYTPEIPQKKQPSKPKWASRRKSIAMPEPEVPAVDFDVPTDIPDPVWDVPDPVLDTSAVLTSFPEIAGDIADLPDIPDIPQI